MKTPFLFSSLSMFFIKIVNCSKSFLRFHLFVFFFSSFNLKTSFPNAKTRTYGRFVIVVRPEKKKKRREEKIRRTIHQHSEIDENEKKLIEKALEKHRFVLLIFLHLTRKEKRSKDCSMSEFKRHSYLLTHNLSPIEKFAPIRRNFEESNSLHIVTYRNFDENKQKENDVDRESNRTF